MVQKHLICPQRIRKIPKGFSWLDHRLVRDHYIDRLTHPATALYLFLVTVSDAQGLSYYSDQAVSQRLSIDANTLTQVRFVLTVCDTANPKDARKWNFKEKAKVLFPFCRILP